MKECIWISEDRGNKRKNVLNLVDDRIGILRKMTFEEGTLVERLDKVGRLNMWTWLRLDVAVKEVQVGEVLDQIWYAMGLCEMEF